MKACVLTISDRGSRGERTDTAGPAAAGMLKEKGFEIVRTEVLPDELDTIKEEIARCAREADLVVTAGGTGLSPRDVTPDATLGVIEREVPGIAEAMRSAGLRQTPRAMLTRGVAGTIGNTLIINLPGSEKAVRESLEAVLDALPHAIEKLQGSGSDCGRR